MKVQNRLPWFKKNAQTIGFQSFPLQVSVTAAGRERFVEADDVEQFPPCTVCWVQPGDGHVWADEHVADDGFGDG